jgi:hypothetical protein
MSSFVDSEKDGNFLGFKLTPTLSVNDASEDRTSLLVEAPNF